MSIAQAALTLFKDPHAPWHADWAWGIPLIVLTVTLHAFGLGLVGRSVIRIYGELMRRHPMAAFTLVMGTTTLLATCLHGIEASIWAATYCLIDALPDFKSAMLYSLNAMTSYGHENLNLEAHWKLMGAIEALNGWLLFGLSTAFLFGMIEKVSPSNHTRH